MFLKNEIYSTRFIGFSNSMSNHCTLHFRGYRSKRIDVEVLQMKDIIKYVKRER